MTTTVVFGSTADGTLRSSNATYATARAGSGLTVNTTDASDNPVGQNNFFGSNGCFEVGLFFDTSGIPDTDTPSAATLELYGFSDNSSGAELTVEPRARNLGGSLPTGDWVAGADLGSDTLLASKDTSGGWSTSGHNTFTSEAAFPGAVSLTGTTELLVSSSRHRAGNAPASNTDEYVRMYLADDSGTTRDPKLTVTHAAAGGGGPVPYRQDRQLVAFRGY